jgi:hypothetical protein
MGKVSLLKAGYSAAWNCISNKEAQPLKDMSAKHCFALCNAEAKVPTQQAFTLNHLCCKQLRAARVSCGCQAESGLGTHQDANSRLLLLLLAAVARGWGRQRVPGPELQGPQLLPWLPQIAQYTTRLWLLAGCFAVCGGVGCCNEEMAVKQVPSAELWCGGSQLLCCRHSACYDGVEQGGCICCEKGLLKLVSPGPPAQLTVGACRQRVAALPSPVEPPVRHENIAVNVVNMRLQEDLCCPRITVYPPSAISVLRCQHVAALRTWACDKDPHCLTCGALDVRQVTWGVKHPRCQCCCSLLLDLAAHLCPCRRCSWDRQKSDVVIELHAAACRRPFWTLWNGCCYLLAAST